MSTSPILSAASRVVSSGITLKTSRLTLGILRQYGSNASNTSSTPGLNDVNLCGPAPMGAFLKPSSPTFSTYFLGTIQPAPVAGDRGDLVLERLRRDAAAPLERELDVLGRDGLAVVELDPFAQHELVDEPVGRHAPRLGPAGGHALPRHRLEERVMQRVEEHDGRRRRLLWPPDRLYTILRSGPARCELAHLLRELIQGGDCRDSRARRTGPAVSSGRGDDRGGARSNPVGTDDLRRGRSALHRSGARLQRSGQCACHGRWGPGP